MQLIPLLAYFTQLSPLSQGTHLMFNLRHPSQVTRRARVLLTLSLLTVLSKQVDLVETDLDWCLLWEERGRFRCYTSHRHRRHCRERA